MFVPHFHLDLVAIGCCRWMVRGKVYCEERQRGRQKRENERKPMPTHSFKQKIQVFYKKKLGKKSLGQPPKKDQLGRSIENLYTVLK